jgi:ABC-type multidrug transport system ATPase subunit
MGPSGSGKTSLLDVLSGRSAYDSGTLTLNGEVLDTKSMKKFKKQIAYVKQDDLFFGHLTVRDQLTYTALLRMPSSWTKQQKLAKVESVINELRLNKCVDSPIFAVSGGERKRVNIGTELLTNPALVILDEPTSGLDSTSAVA